MKGGFSLFKINSMLGSLRNFATRGIRGVSTVGKPIECMAAVAWAPKKDYWEDALSLEKVSVAPPSR